MFVWEVGFVKVEYVLVVELMCCYFVECIDGLWLLNCVEELLVVMV